ncbi:MAG: heat shock protein HtpX [Actinomycetota bacterium]|jgi:heat shock protein HtpX|nr:heat shock protein HtpX [Actinomycetota bacterium]
MDKNIFKTGILLAALGGLLIGVGSLFGGNGAWIGFGIGLVFTMGSYWFSDKIAVRAARAKPVTEQEAPELYRIVRELTTQAGMPMPAIYMSPATQPNAFATGRNEHHAAVAVTEGIMPLLTEDELKGVLAHELSHVRHHDILITSVAASVALGITMIARIVLWGSMFGFGGDNRRGGNIFGALALMILAPLAAGLLQMALSRSREYDADLGGAQLLGTGEPLARALEKIDAAARQVPMNVDPAHATAYIINPLTGRKVNFSTLYSTHPPTADRIARLRSYHP